MCRLKIGAGERGRRGGGEKCEVGDGEERRTGMQRERATLGGVKNGYEWGVSARTVL